MKEALSQTKSCTGCWTCTEFAMLLLCFVSAQVGNHLFTVKGWTTGSATHAIILPPPVKITQLLFPPFTSIWWRGYDWTYRSHREHFLLGNHLKDTLFFPMHRIWITTPVLHSFPDLTNSITDTQSQFLQKQNFNITFITRFKGNQATMPCSLQCKLCLLQRT